MKKVNDGFTVGKSDIYTPKASLDSSGSSIDYNTDIINKPDLSDLHTHANKTLLDSIINSGDGNSFLANDGAYKTLASLSSINMNDILDVSASSPGNDYVLKYSTGSSQWIASSHSWLSSGDNISELTNDTGFITNYSVIKADITQFTYTYNDLGLTEYTDADAIAAIKSDASWNAANWDTAYGWGNHAEGGYYVKDSDDADDIDDSSSTNKFVTTSEKSDWNTAFGWGDHSTVGYLTSVDLSGYLQSGDNISELVNDA